MTQIIAFLYYQPATTTAADHPTTTTLQLNIEKYIKISYNNSFLCFLYCTLD